MSRFVYQGTLQDGNGKRLADGNVAVLLAGTATPASIYAASTGGVAVASVTTEDDGSWSFYIDEADYAGTQRFDVVRSKSGYLSLTTEDIEVLPASTHVGLTIKDTTDRTKIATLSAAGITTANTRVHTLPDFDAGVVGADHGGTITKIIKFLVSGATAAKTMILASAHTDDRTQTLQDRDGTIANTSAETFTGGMTVVGGMTGNASTATSAGAGGVNTTPGGDFTAGTIRYWRVGNQVVVSWEGVTFTGTTQADSAVGAVPAGYVPTHASGTYNIVSFNSTAVFEAFLAANGQLTFVFLRWDGSTYNPSSMLNGSVTFVVA